VNVYRLGGGESDFPASVANYVRLPGGHPEGFHEALANLHRTIQWQIRRRNGETTPDPFPHPDVIDGAAGMAFVEAAVQSSSDNGAWTAVKPVE